MCILSMRPKAFTEGEAPCTGLGRFIDLPVRGRSYDVLFEPAPNRQCADGGGLQQRCHDAGARDQAILRPLREFRFDLDKATIQRDADALLDDIATALRNFPDWRLRIIGHTDVSGTPAK